MYNLLDKDLKKQYDRDVFDDLMEEWGMPPLPPVSPATNVPVPAPVDKQDGKA